MKFRVAFFISKTEHKFRLRFWKWDIWRFYSEQETDDIKNDSSKAGFLSFEKKNETNENSSEKKSDYGKLLFQALFYPEIERRIWHASKNFARRAFKLFSISFDNIEIKGSLGDPFYDAMALGMSNGCYFPDWENENKNCSIKGEIVLTIKFFRSVFFAFSIIYETVVLAFVLWRGTRLAKKNPNGKDLGTIRRWIFLKTREAL